MTQLSAKAQRFLDLHTAGAPLLLPNPWDAGSAKLLESLGFDALATTSSGHAMSLGRLDGNVQPEEALAHATAIVSATDLPVSADLENGFADDPDGVAAIVRRARETGLAGCSIEDSTQRSDDPIYAYDLAVERVSAAVDAAHAGADALVLTARAENHLHGKQDLADTIRRLQAYEAAGADVLYAPGLVALDDIRSVVQSVSAPVNVLLVPGGPTLAELAGAGVRRVSVGGAFAYVALGALAAAGRELLDGGALTFWDGVKAGRSAVRSAFTAG